MIVDDLKKSILITALQGKLTEQLSSDSSVENLLESIKYEKDKLISEGKISKKKQNIIITSEELPFTIPDNWKWVRWGELSNSIQYGINTGAESNGNAKLVRISDIQNNKVIWEDVPYCKIEEKEIEQFLLNENDILFARTGGTVGKSVIVKDIPTDIPYVFAGYLIRSNYNSQMNYKYLKYFMESPLYWEQLRSGTIGSAQPNCNGQTLSKMILPLPPLEEQQRIVDKLDELFNKLDEVKYLEDELIQHKITFPVEMKNSIVQSAVSGKLTTQNINEDVSLIVKQIENKINKKVRNVSNYPFEIPKNWMWIKFGDLVNFEIGKTPPRADSSFWNGEFNWVSISDMIENGYINDTKEMVSFKANNELFKGKISRAGTLLMSFKLTVGRCSILNIDAFHNEGIISIYPNYDSAIIKKYLFKVLPFIVKFGDTKGAIKGNTLNSKSLDNLMIPLPPIEEQQRIVDKLEQLLPLCNDIKKLVSGE